MGVSENGVIYCYIPSNGYCLIRENDHKLVENASHPSRRRSQNLKSLLPWRPKMAPAQGASICWLLSAPSGIKQKKPGYRRKSPRFHEPPILMGLVGLVLIRIDTLTLLLDFWAINWNWPPTKASCVIPPVPSAVPANSCSEMSCAAASTPSSAMNLMARALGWGHPSTQLFGGVSQPFTEMHGQVNNLYVS